MNGVKFDFYHSYSFFDLLLNSKEIGTPEIKKNLIEIAGADGYVDLTYFFGNEPKYENRTLQFDFTIKPSVGVSQYLSKYNNICTVLHGTKRKIILDEDSGYYFYGIISVGSYKCEKGNATFTITCDCEPFRCEVNETTVSQYVNGTATFQLNNSRKRVVPTITTTSEMLFRYDGVYYNRPSAGTFTIPEIELKNGNNVVEVTGVGTVSFKYTKGRL